MREGLVAVLLLAACGHTGYRAPLTCPERGGPQWIELRSAHFRLRTDLSPRQARLALSEYEQAHRFQQHHVPDAPLWVWEGLAEYFETLLIEGAQLTVGGRESDVTGFPPLQEILNTTYENFHEKSRDRSATATITAGQITNLMLPLNNSCD